MPLRLSWLRPAALASVGLVALALSGRADPAPNQGDAKQGRDSVATCMKIDGALLERGKDGHFTLVKSGDKIPPHKLLIGFPEAELVSSCGKVQINLELYLGEQLPVTEAGIILNDSPELNADITIDRGVVGLKGLAKSGDTLIRVRSGEQSWMLMLKDPDSQVLVARFGRHQPGTKLTHKGPKKLFIDDPSMHMGVLVVKGRVTVDTGHATYAMNAPPGPALVTWDSVAGYEVKRFDKLPDEVRQLDAIEAQRFKEICELTAKLAAGDMGKGLDQMIASDVVRQHRVAVACMAGLDDLPRLVAALENPKHADVRDVAIFALRNWVGREKGHLTRLHDYLTKEKKYTPVQARTIVQLLKGFDDNDRKEPLVYELLIEGKSTVIVKD